MRKKASAAFPLNASMESSWTDVSFLLTARKHFSLHLESFKRTFRKHMSGERKHGTLKHSQAQVRLAPKTLHLAVLLHIRI